MAAAHGKWQPSRSSPLWEEARRCCWRRGSAPPAQWILGLAAGFLGLPLLLAPVHVMVENTLPSFPVVDMPTMDTALAVGHRAEQAYGQQEEQERTARRGSNF